MNKNRRDIDRRAKSFISNTTFNPLQSYENIDKTQLYARSKGPVSGESIYKTIQSSDSIDIHKLMSKIPFSTTGIPQEFNHFTGYRNHLTYLFCEPNRNLFNENKSRRGRLNEDPRKENYLTPKEWSKPINPLDEAAYRHDLKYYFAGDDRKLKHIADDEIIKELENYTPNTYIKKIL